MFWHQFNRRKLSGPAQFIVQKIMRLPKGTRLSRHMTIFLTFLTSGLLHLVTDGAMGVPMRESGALQFFAVQPIAIIVEDGVQALYRLTFGARRKEDDDRPSSSPSSPPLWIRSVGYFWLILFLSWSTPVWSFPLLYRNSGRLKSSIVPFSIVRWYVK